MTDKKGAFTLAEIMIVFTVIGILTAILIPTLFASAPEQEKLRAKKAFNTLTRAVETLTNSGPYDTNDGLLDATPFVTNTETDLRQEAFFCNNLVEVLNVKKADCSNGKVPDTAIKLETDNSTPKKAKYADLQTNIDDVCSKASTGYYDNVGVDTFDFITADNIMWGVQHLSFSDASTITVNGVTMPSAYTVVCFDVARHTSSDHMYGAGIRRDGKIVVGAKLQALIDEDYADSN